MKDNGQFGGWWSKSLAQAQLQQLRAAIGFIKCCNLDLEARASDFERREVERETWETAAAHALPVAQKVVVKRERPTFNKWPKRQRLVTELD